MATADPTISHDGCDGAHEEADIYVREVVPVGSDEAGTSGIDYQVLPKISSITGANKHPSNSYPVSLGSIGALKRSSQELTVREKQPLTDDLMAQCLREAKKRRVEEEVEDADISFLKSLVPDMKKMNDRQKNRFKRNVLSVIDDILYSN